MRRNRTVWTIIFGLAALLTVSAFYLRHTRGAAAQTSEATPALQTATVRRGTLTLSATGAGSVIPAAETHLSFGSSGTVTELLVQVGSKVQAGDVLARLDDNNARQSVAQAELQVAQAQLAVDADTVARTVRLAELAVSRAEISVQEAQNNLDDLTNWTADPDAVALAQAKLDAAQASYTAAQGQDASKRSSITSAEISLRQAQESLTSAQENYDNAFDSARDWERNIDGIRDAAATSLQRAQDNLTIAQANYDSARLNLNYASSINAQTSVLSAEQALADAQTSPTEAETEAARVALQNATIALTEAQINLEKAKDNRSAQLSLEQAQLNLSAAQATLEQTTLTAPTAGTVTAIAATVGETGGNDFITLADLEQPLLEVYLDETDMGMAIVGNEVDIVFDALPDQTFVGRIIQVNPQLVNNNGLTTVQVTVQLNADSFAKPQNLPVGLNATAEVVGGRAEQALLVPVEALRELSAGQYAVFVMEDGEPKLRPVEVGLMDFTSAEILSGLQAGDIVTTGIVETQ